MADSYLRSMRIAVHEFIELDSLEAIFVLVSHGLGVSLVPDWMPSWEKGLSLRKLSIGKNAPVRSVGLLWARNSPAIHLIETLMDVLTSCVRPGSK